MIARLSKILIFLAIANCAIAQCDSALSICDSVTVAQSNEIVRLHGVVAARDATLMAYGDMFRLQRESDKIMSDWQDTRYEKAKDDFSLHEKFFVAWIFISTIILFLHH